MKSLLDKKNFLRNTCMYIRVPIKINWNCSQVEITTQVGCQRDEIETNIFHREIFTLVILISFQRKVSSKEKNYIGWNSPEKSS